MSIVSARLAQAWRWLRGASWSYVLGLVVFVILSAAILTLGAAPGSGRALIWPLGKKLVGMLVLAKCAAHYQGHARLRAALAGGAGWGAAVAALIPRPAIAWLRLDQANVRACLAWIARRPHPVRPPGTSFTLLKKSGYGTVVLILLVGVFGELPMHATIVGAMVKDAAVQKQVQLIMLALALYSLLWIAGDRRAMQGSRYVVGEDVFDVVVGNRFSAAIPLRAIVGCAALAQGESGWRERNAVAPEATLTITPADAPNVMIAIDPQAALTVVSWQLERPAPATLFLFADEPAQLIATLKQAANPAS